MRQPASLSNALPRHDHHEYGPATSGCNSRTTSTQPDPNSSVSHCLSTGRNPDFFTLPRQFLMSFSVCAMFQSPQTTASRSVSVAIRCASAAMNRSFSSWRSVPASPV
jgi:hypothetical protein